MLPMPRLSFTCLSRAWHLAATAILLVNGLSLAQPDSSGGCNQEGSPRVAALELQGLKTTRSEVVLRELRNRVGQPFSCDAWIAEQSRLEDLDIFADVRLRVVPKEVPGDASGGPPEKSEVELTYVFRELPPYIPFVAVSKTEQDGLSIGPALASLNFLGQGIRAEFITRFGGTTELQASLSSSRFWDLPLKYDLAVLRVDSYNNFEAFHEDSWRAKLDLAQGLAEAGLPEPAYIIYAGELFWMRAGNGDGDDSTFPSRILLDEKGDFVPRLGTGFMWDGRDRRHNPRRGLYQEVRVTQNGGFLGGPADFREWLSDTRAYLPLHPRITLALSGLYRFRDGTTGESFGRYDRFHAGGVNTLRGYSHDAFRGKSEFVLTAENRMDWIRKRTLRLWRWSGYYGLQGILGWEAASLWDHNALLERDFHSAGFVGLHLLVAGADRIRFEVGSKFAKIQFEADVGILDKADVQRFRAR